MNRLQRFAVPIVVAIGSAQAVAPAAAQQSAPALSPDAPIIEVTAVDYAFRAPESMHAGWNVIRFTNDGEDPHFVFMIRLPAGRTIEDYERDVSAPFARGWYAIRDGSADQDEGLNMILEALPDWFPELTMVGGPGLVSPGLTSEAMLHLEPGDYVLECYVKTAEGELHMMDGMVRPITVSPMPSPATPPEPDVLVTLSNDGMTVEGDLAAGRRVIGVHARENPEQGFGHSAHLARLDGSTTPEAVIRWMNWLDQSGLRAPAPATFLGGTHAMPTGDTMYFTADLEPGRYIIVSEATGHLGVVHEFAVH
jgi:hypothetical protein